MSANPPAFRKATKHASKLRLALVGPPGSGKTWTSLVVATALGGPIALLDTERGSASKYADAFDFDVLELEESFHPRRYVEAIHAAEQAAYATVIIDSLSHAWIGKDGGLDLHDQAVARQKTKNPYTAWADVTPHHNALVQALVQSKCHVIATLRSKVEYAQEKDERTGKTNIRKIGTAPIMREGIEYEADVVGDLDTDNTLVISKTRCPALAGKAFPKPGADFTRPLLAWLQGSPPPAASAPANGNRLPADGVELKRRLEDYERRLIVEELCASLELMAYILKLGTEAGYERDMTRWPREAIARAVQWTKEFEASRRQAVAGREPGVDAPE
jgi:hypothetical protein